MFPDLPSPQQDKIQKVYERLIQTYGERPLKPRREPMRELVSTMLSHRTTHQNEEKAFDQMWQRFGSWQGICDAPVEKLAEAIAPATFPEAKAPNIQKSLRCIIEECGQPSIDFLQDWPADEGLAWLMKLPGVGIKTASLVLLFCFAKPVLPVDTHVHRISQRTGLIGPKVNANAAHQHLLELLPQESSTLYNFHISMLRHGQRVCVWGTPHCEKCPLTDLCDWYQNQQ